MQSEISHSTGITETWSEISKRSPHWWAPLLGGLIVSVLAGLFFWSAGLLSDHFHLSDPEEANARSEGKPHLGPKAPPAEADAAENDEENHSEESTEPHPHRECMPEMAKGLVVRLVWWVSASALGVLMIVASLISGYVTHRSLRSLSSPQRYTLYTVVGSACLAILLFFTFSPTLLAPHIFRDFFKVLEGKSVEEGHNTQSAQVESGEGTLQSGEQSTKKEKERTPKQRERARLWQGLSLAANVLLGFTAAAVLMVCLGCCSLLVGTYGGPAPSSRGTPGGSNNGSQVAKLLAERQKLLRLLLYTCALLLIAGVFEIYALHSWPTIYYVLKRDQDAIRTIAASFAAGSGVFFTLYLAGIFLPTAVILRVRSHGLVPSSVEGSEQRKEWLKGAGVDETDLYATPTQYLWQGLAVLAPMLIGLLGRLIEFG